MSKELTREEFYEVYGNVYVSFHDYYKFTFYFEGTTKEGYRVRVGYGGNSGDIYRYDLEFNSTETVISCCPYIGKVYDKDGNEIASFYDTSA